MSKKVEGPDLQRYPLEKKAHEYLTSRGERPPFRFFVRRKELVNLATTLGRQITLEEAQAIIREDRMMVCSHPAHTTEHSFMGVRRLVLTFDGKVEPAPIEGVPESLWPFIRRYPDGSPMEMGSVALVPDKEGGWKAAPLCGSRYFVQGGTEVVHNRSHLGVYVRVARKAGLKGYTYALAGAERAAAIRAEKRALNEERRREAEAQIRKILGRRALRTK